MASANQAPNRRIECSEFWCEPDDSIDDTNAIQSAIDSLPRGTHPVAGEPIGGIIYLPKGTYKISKPLLIYSGVVLRGEGSQTVLNGVSSNASDWSFGCIACSDTEHDPRRVENLTVYTNVSKGIDTPASDDGAL